MTIENPKLLQLLKTFEETVHLHTKYLDRCRNIVVLKSRPVDQYSSRLRKLKRISEKLERVLQDMLDTVNSGHYDHEIGEKLELLLFYISETALPSEKEVWSRLGSAVLATVGLDIDEQLSRINRVEVLSKSIYSTIVDLK